MITIEFIISTFKKFNESYFGGSLLLPKFEITNSKSYYGLFHCEDYYSWGGSCVIRISSYWDFTEEECASVLIHEMVHEWQWVKGYKIDHSYTFQNKAEEINSITNNKYDICTHSNFCLANKNIGESEYRGLAVTYCKYGERYIFVTTMNYIKTLLGWLPKKANVSNIKVYEVSGFAFNGMRQSRSRINGYLYNSSYDEYLIREIEI